jgi:HlyD family secretion protein
MERRTIIILVVVALIGIGYFGYKRYVTPKPEPTPIVIEEEVKEVVSASGEVLPSRWAFIGFEIGGRIEEIVEEGEEVKEGQPLARLDATDLEHAVAQAKASLSLAEAELAKAKAGARPEEITAAEGEVEAAEANLRAAEAKLKASEAELARLEAGARPEEIEIAEAGLRKAETALEQAYRAYQPIEWQPGSEVTPLGYAWRQATHESEIARAKLSLLKAGATKEEIALARANVDAAKAGVEAAKARLSQAEARLRILKSGATAEEIAVLEARVEQAKASLLRAEAALEKALLLAPFSGTIGAVWVREGEIVAPGKPIIAIGDLSAFLVETTDLNEIDIAKVKKGQKVEITFDALPGRKLEGRVVRIAPMASLGGTNYTVTIEFEKQDPALRWGMTAFVDILVE